MKTHSSVLYWRGNRYPRQKRLFQHVGLFLLRLFSHQSAAVRRISWTQPAAPSPPDSGWDSWTERPLWTAGCFCGGGRPARRGDVWAAGWGACTDTVYQHPAEGRKQGKWTLTAVRQCLCEEKNKKMNARNKKPLNPEHILNLPLKTHHVPPSSSRCFVARYPLICPLILEANPQK